jgi:hypothetical protein
MYARNVPITGRKREYNYNECFDGEIPAQFDDDIIHGAFGLEPF